MNRQPLPIPSNAKRAPHAHRELLYLLPAAAFVVAGLWAFCVLVFTLVPGPR